MRVSPLSSTPSTSWWAGSASKRRRQQPVPPGPGSVVSLMQSPRGMLPAFCSDGAGLAYGRTVFTVLTRRRSGAPSRERVLVSAQVTRRFERSVALTSLAASELRNSSVPRARLSKRWSGPTDGQSVKPASRASPTLTAPTVSIWVTLTVAAPDVSARLEKAYRFALWNSGPNSEYSLVVTKIPSRSAPMWGKSPMQAVGGTTRGGCPPGAQPWFGLPVVPSAVTSTRATAPLPRGGQGALDGRARR